MLLLGQKHILTEQIMIRMLKKLKEQNKCVINRILLKFNDYRNCLFKNEIILKSQQRFKSEAHFVYTEEVNKITLSSNDDRRFVVMIVM